MNVKNIFEVRWWYTQGWTWHFIALIQKARILEICRNVKPDEVIWITREYQVLKCQTSLQEIAVFFKHTFKFRDHCYFFTENKYYLSTYIVHFSNCK